MAFGYKRLGAISVSVAGSAMPDGRTCSAVVISILSKPLAAVGGHPRSGADLEGGPRRLNDGAQQIERGSHECYATHSAPLRIAVTDQFSDALHRACAIRPTFLLS